MKTIRPGQESDYPLIYATWLRSQYHGSPWFSKIDSKAFFDNYKGFVERRLATSKIVVACSDKDPDVVFAYAVISPDDTTLHYIYTKRAWRKLGIAKSLLPSTISTTSSLTGLGDFINKGRLAFNPFK